MKWMAVFVVGIVTVAGTSAFLLASSKSAPRGAEPHATVAEKVEVGNPARDAETARLASQVAALQLQVAQLNAAPAASATPSTAGRASGDGVAESPPLSRTEQRVADEQRRRAMMEAVEAEYHNEQTDRGWAIATEAKIQSALQEDNIHLQTRSVECRSETCRIEIVDNGSPATQESVENLSPVLSGSLPSMQVSRTDDASGHHMVLYFSRTQPAAQK